MMETGNRRISEKKKDITSHAGKVVTTGESGENRGV